MTGDAEAKTTYQFGALSLDPGERLLLREGRPVALTPKAFDLLVYLVEHHGRLVEKATLIATLWPDAIVEEANLAFQISALRKVLDDGGTGESLIQTVPTRGYRFIAPVTTSPARVPAPRNRRLAAGAVAILLAGAVATSVWVRSKLATPVATSAPLATPPAFKQLTANPAQLPVNSQAISPDGKYLAYSDRTGIQVEVIDSGEVQRLPETRGMEVSGWSDDGTRIRAIEGGAVRTIWDVSLVGSTRRRTGLVWPDEAIALAPDACCFLKIMPDGELRLEPLHGTPRSLLRLAADDWIRTAVWTPDAKRIFFVRGRNREASGLGSVPIETVAVDSGAPSAVFTPPDGQVIRTIGPPGRDGRMIAVLGERGRPSDVHLWEVRTDTHTGLLAAEPRRLTSWSEKGCSQITQSADGRRVALLAVTSQMDVYVAAFDERATSLNNSRRLTLNERDDYPTAWTPDNKSVIFSSTRTGRQLDIYEQDIDGGEPRLLVSGDDNKDLARVSADGRWILFVQSPFLSTGLLWPTRVMRAPIEGGIAEEVYASRGSLAPQCSIAKGCIIYERRGDKGVISSLDPMRGKGAELATVPVTTSGYILPGGNEFAYIVDQDRPRNHIRIISLVGKPTRDITVTAASLLQNLDPLPDSSGWISVNVTEPYNQLLYIRRDGQSHVLWTPDHASVAAGIPSRDGKRLAIETYTSVGNVWMMTEF